LTISVEYIIFSTNLIQQEQTGLKLSTRGNYGVRAVYELARHYGKGPLQIKQISERQDIPPRYLEQLLHRLKKGGIITSIRGPSGGYELSDDPVNLSVGDIFRILEGPFHMAGCVQSVDKRHCSRNGNCISNQLWSKVQRQDRKSTRLNSSHDV
jgi:Rrf2 family protein